MSELRETLINITEEKNTKIIPSNIKEGVQIFDVIGEYKGLDTSDATIVNTDIPLNKIAYANGEKIVGIVDTVKTGSSLWMPTTNLSISDTGLLGIYNFYAPIHFNGNTVGRITITNNTLVNTYNLTAKDLALDVQLMGLTGTYTGIDVSDATATAEDIRAGMTAYGADGHKMVGTYEDLDNIQFILPDNATTTNNGTIGQWIYSVDPCDLKGLTSLSNLFYNMQGIRQIANISGNGTITNMTNVCYNCRSLLQIPNFNYSKVNVFSNAFSNCISLIDVNVDSSAGYQCGSMFSNCINLQSVNFTSFANIYNAAYMFMGCSNLVNISDLTCTKLKLANSMFKNCSNLEHVGLSKTIGGYDTNSCDMFYGCHKLKDTAYLAFSSASSGWGGAINKYRDCYNITDAVITCPSGGSTSATSAFMNCYNLTNLSLWGTNYYTYGGVNYMFANCTNLKVVPPFYIQSGYIAGLFYGCSNLTDVQEMKVGIPSGSSSYYNYDGVFNNCTSLVNVNLTFLNAMVLSNWFESCVNLQTIPEGVYNSGYNHTLQYAFRNCHNLRILPEGVFNKMPNASWNYAFWFTNNITEIPYCNVSHWDRIPTMFSNTHAFSNQTLDNLMAMTLLINNTTKQLSSWGVTEEQANICSGLSNYQNFIDGGGTSGFTNLAW